MARRPSRRLYAAAIIERPDNRVLIALPTDMAESDRRWQFPRGHIEAGESPEAAIRRVARQQLGVGVEIVVGQPPLLARLEDAEAKLRYFFCGITTGEAQAGPYAEIRWVLRPHLQEYDFDSASQQVADWLVNSQRR
jgi:8-oxo-dGTP diphosphatase